MRFLPSVSASRTAGVLELTHEAAARRLACRGHTLHELLRRGDLTRLYLDRDVYLDAQPDAATLAAHEADVRAHVEALLKHVREILLLAGPSAANDSNTALADDSNPALDYVVATRHGFSAPKQRYKLSSRPFVRGVRVDYTEIPRLLRACGQEAFWDMTVYKATEQLLACVNGIKARADPRVLLPQQPEPAELLDYLAQHAPPDWPLLVVPHEVAHARARGPAPAPARICNSASADTDPARADDAELATALAALLGAHLAHDRATWVQAGIALKRCGAGFQAFRAFSMKSDKFGEEDCRRTWGSFDAGGAATQERAVLGMGTLCKMARESDPEAYAALRRHGWTPPTPNAARHPAPAHGHDAVCKLVAALGLDAGEPLRVPKPPVVDERSLSVVAELADGRRWAFVLRFEDLKVTVTESAESAESAEGGRLVCNRHIHAAQAIDVVGHDLAALHKDIASGQQWSLTRPTDGKALFASTSATIEFLNVDRPGQETARLELIGMRKNARLTSKRDMAMLSAAMVDAQNRALVERLELGWAVMGNHNTVNIYHGGGDADPKLHTSDGIFGEILMAKLADRLHLVAGSTREWWTFQPATGLWSHSEPRLAAHRLRNVAKDDAAFWASLSDPDRRYLDSERGCTTLLDAICDHPRIYDASFADRLDQLPPGRIPFDNGLFDVADASFRPFAKDDLVSKTIGYAYEPPGDAPSGPDRVMEDFYAKALPDPEEREYFLRLISTALFGATPQKAFLVLTDERDGSNGKTTLMRAVEAAFGIYTAPAERSFIYEDSGNAPNGHAANFLAYAGKRLAFFDEPEPKMRLAMRKIKELASGDARIRGREISSANVVDCPWSTFIVIACNECNFPAIDAADAPMVKRMKALKMRAVFVEPGELGNNGRYEGEEHVYERQADGFTAQLKSVCRLAHFRLFAAAYQRVLANGGRVGAEPACIAETVQRILVDADPRIQRALEFVDERIDFNPPRPPSAAGKHYYAWITQKDLGKAFWEFHTADPHDPFRRAMAQGTDKKSEWKGVLARAMEMRGRPLHNIRPTSEEGARMAVDAYDRTAWKGG